LKSKIKARWRNSVDALDSKSSELMLVRVRVSPSLKECPWRPRKMSDFDPNAIEATLIIVAWITVVGSAIIAWFITHE
jgi:hypothetical protein